MPGATDDRLLNIGRNVSHDHGLEWTKGFLSANGQHGHRELHARENFIVRQLFSAFYSLSLLPRSTLARGGYGRIVGVRSKFGPKDDAVTGIPSSTRAYTIHEHCDAPIEAKRQVLQATAGDGSWFRAGIANAVRTTQLTVSELGPGILAGVETDVAISATKLPFPQPVRFRAGTVQPPAESLQPGRHGRHRFAVDSCRDVQALTLIRIMARFLKRSR